LPSPNAIGRFRAARRALEDRLGETSLVAVLLGAEGRGLAERAEIARALRARGMIALIPEADFPSGIGPSLAERIMLTSRDVDLVFLNVQSWGTATELGQFHADPEIAPKLRILVAPEYHPVHSTDSGYLRDLYLTHLVAYGHVYPVDGGRQAPIPSAVSLVAMLSERHRQWKAIRGHRGTKARYTT